MQNRSTGKCPFEVIYTYSTYLTFDLLKLPPNVDLSAEVDHKLIIFNRFIRSCEQSDCSNKKYKIQVDIHSHHVTFSLVAL